MKFRSLLSLAFALATTMLFAQDVSITFNLGTSNIDVDAGGIYLAGGGNFGNPGDNEMTDDDGDGIYSITITKEVGFSSFYTFANGNCPGFECKESIAGQACADPNNFNDRFLPAVMNDTIINTCFALCTDDTNCGAPPVDANITFTVDMNEYAVAVDSMALAGNFNGWAAAANPMTSLGDSLYSVTIPLASGSQYEYKFVAFSGGAETFEALDPLDGQSCVMNFGGFVNRIFTAQTTDATLPTVCFQSCQACGVMPSDSVDVTFNLGTSNIDVDAGGIYLAGGGNFGNPGDNPMTDDDGDGVYSITIRRPIGFSSFYTFANGNCPGFECKESIAGQDCADPANFNDRFLPAVMADTVINTCFGECTIDTNCGAPPIDANVTFTVDMNEYSVAVDSMALAGNFNGWTAAANPMTSLGDSLYSVTIPLATGSQYEYKFVAFSGGVETFETLDPLDGQSCVMNFGGFVNRIFTPQGVEETIPTVCFQSCQACGFMPVDSVDITFNVGTSEIDVDAAGIFIAGGGLFGNPGDFALNDDDGDGVWSITVRREVGFGGNYTFTNGACPDYGCKEDIAGQTCADAGNFNDRILPAVMNDTIINTCFGECIDGTTCTPIVLNMVTFRVNVADIMDPITSVSLAGTFNGWDAGATPMTDDDGDMIYEVTVEMTGGQKDYKFVVNGTFEEFTEATDGCTMAFGEFINRIVDVTGGDQDVATVCFESCEDCSVNTIDLNAYGVAFDLYPTVAKDRLFLNLNQPAGEESTLDILNASGQVLQTLNLRGSQQRQIDVTGLASGFYFARLQHADAVGVKRFVKD